MWVVVWWLQFKFSDAVFLFLGSWLWVSVPVVWPPRFAGPRAHACTPTPSVVASTHACQGSMGRRPATLSLHCAICVSLARVCSLPNKSCCRVLSSLPLPPATPAAECGSRKFVVSSEHPVVLCSPALPVPPPPLGCQTSRSRSLTLRPCAMAARRICPLDSCP